ncbi:type II toxin-antitoxin system VapC family toxin [Nostoc favosum]|uniref:Type II toxin-antitoxin system VapC family toxin n=1 Tax=Nostoc favosum CHAB5714 TaxID=2780399 RepID=A0ABS8IE50_9NOSO|nr:type II toxin-antitoxin system VapC family toxin [Nostoc favosum]MCC5602502.1 type II toxin-antitoxin system VapC family toxin [Nostoc favosum CHAB5714]
MTYLVDTNLLLLSVQPHHPMYADTLNAISTLPGAEEELFITSQNLIEFWRSATRPAQRNGLGLTIAEARMELESLEGLFLVLPDVPEIYPEWKRLILQYGVAGVNVHDARLVALMLVHRLTHILTFNVRDFNRYASEVTPLNPTSFTSRHP